jgi:hypothetical protein
MSVFSGVVLRNHSKLVECKLDSIRVRMDKADLVAVGSLFIPSVLRDSGLANRLVVLRNPFTLTIAGASAAILLGSMVIPP